jgi:hypothetical protein
LNADDTLTFVASVRIHSKKNYGNGLIVLDLAAMPSNKCSQWAAFWMNSGEKQWPYGGEVDVIEVWVHICLRVVGAHQSSRG